MRSRIYETVERPFDCLSVPSFDRRRDVHRVCCWAPCWQEISIDSGGGRGPAATGDEARRWAANAGSVTFTANARSWTHVKGSLYSITDRIGFRSWSRFLAISLQVTWVVNPAVGCHYFPPGLQLPLQPLRGLLPILLLGEQRHNWCEQFA